MTPDMLRNEVDVLRKLTERGPHERIGRGLLTELTAVHEDPTYVRENTTHRAVPWSRRRERRGPGGGSSFGGWARLRS